HDEAPYRVFTAYWRAASPGISSDAPESAPRRLHTPPHWPNSNALEDLALLPVPDWAGGLRAAWRPGETGAPHALEYVARTALPAYEAPRKMPELEGASRVSPYLHFGELSPRQVWCALLRREAHSEPGSSKGKSIEKFKQELGWREFATYLLAHLPQLPDHSL